MNYKGGGGFAEKKGIARTKLKATTFFNISKLQCLNARFFSV